MKLIAAGVTFLLVSAPVRAQEELSVDAILSRVSISMRVLLATLPEFVCTETITSSRWDKGKLKEERRVESTLTFVSDARAFSGMREVREIAAIDGKPQGPNAKMPDLPVRGEFLISMLFARFVASPPSTAYRLAGAADMDGAPFGRGSAPRRALRI